MTSSTNVLHQNIDQLINKSDLLILALEELTNNSKSIDIVCITEYSMKTEDVSIVNIPNYKLGFSFNQNNRNGGICILIRHGLNYNVIDAASKFSVTNIIECSTAELTDHNFIILCIYKVREMN